MSKDDTRIGSLKQVVELRARIAELERENDALSMEASENLQRREKAESDFKELSISSNARVAEGLLARSAVALAAERWRREAAEVILREMAKLYAGQIDNNGNYCNQLHDSARAHFARYYKD